MATVVAHCKWVGIGIGGGRIGHTSDVATA